MKSNFFSNITQQLQQTENSSKPDNKWFRFKRESDSIGNQMMARPNPFFDMKQESHDFYMENNPTKKVKSKHNRRFALKSKRASIAGKKT